MTRAGEPGESRAAGGLGGAVSPPTSDAPDAPHHVIVPRRPGRLLYLSWVENDEDSIDPTLTRRDRLFGRVTTEARGLLDVALLVTGLGLLTWALIDRHAPGVGTLGMLSIVLGAAIPARDGAHALDAAWGRARDRFDRRRGTPLDAGETNVAKLVIAYDDVFEIARKLPNRDLAADVRRLAHASLVDLAAEMPGGRPTDPGERELVRVRIRALRRIDDALKRATSAHQQWVVSRLKSDRQQRGAWEADIVRARANATAAEVSGPVAALEALAVRIETEAGYVFEG